MRADRVETTHHTVTGWPGAGRPAHADRPSSRPPLLPAAVGGALLLAAIGLVAAACLHSTGSSPSTPTSASQITRDTAAPVSQGARGP